MSVGMGAGQNSLNAQEMLAVYQITDVDLNRIRVKYVSAPDHTHETGQSIVKRLRARIGPLEILLERVAEVPRDTNGKFRAVVSHLSPEEYSGMISPQKSE